MFRDKELCSVLFLGFCLMIILSSDFTYSSLQKILTKAIEKENPNYKINASSSMAIVYLSAAIFMWFSPSVLSVIGPKYALILGSIGLIFLVTAVTFETSWATYVGMILAGCGIAIVWVALGNYLALISNASNMPKNYAIFWVFYSLSMIVGNIFATIQIHNMVDMDKTTRHTILYVLTGSACFGAVLLLFLPRPICKNSRGKNNKTPLEALKATWKIFSKHNIQLLLIPFAYEGFQDTFGQAVYGASLGFVKKLGYSAKVFAPLAGVCYGVGHLTGGMSVIFLSRRLKHLMGWSRAVFCSGFVFQMLSMISILINIPNDAVFGETDSTALITPKAWLALLSSFLFGLGNSSISTQIIPLITKLEPKNSAQTNAIFKFTKSVAMTVYFFISSFLGLHFQILVMFCSGTLAATIFSLVEYKHDVNNRIKANEN